MLLVPSSRGWYIDLGQLLSVVDHAEVNASPRLGTSIKLLSNTSPALQKILSLPASPLIRLVKSLQSVHSKISLLVDRDHEVVDVSYC